MFRSFVERCGQCDPSTSEDSIRRANTALDRIVNLSVRVLNDRLFEHIRVRRPCIKPHFLTQTCFWCKHTHIWKCSVRLSCASVQEYKEYLISISPTACSQGCCFPHKHSGYDTKIAGWKNTSFWRVAERYWPLAVLTGIASPQGSHSFVASFTPRWDFHDRKLARTLNMNGSHFLSKANIVCSHVRCLCNC